MSDFKEIEETQHHIVSPRIYAAVAIALLVLTATTAGLSYVELGVFNAVVALTIAVSKTMLVVLFFMHVKYSTKLTKLTVIAGLFTLMALIGMTMADYFTRAWGRW